MDLFDAQGVDSYGLPQPSASGPLAVRMRPTTVEELLGQAHLLTPGSPLARLLDSQSTSVPSVILWGPPGTGKTTLAYLIARQSGRRFAEVSAVNAGVKEVREVIASAKHALMASGEETVLFIDEVHRFSKSQQDALLPAVENQWITLVAATTENPSFSVISPLLSRSLLLVLHPLDDEAIGETLQRALKSASGLNAAVELGEGSLGVLTRIAGGDARKALTLLEAAAAATLDRGDRLITVEDVSTAAASALVRWDEDQHYDVASAFIKSMRGSDPNAAVHYLARMLEAGEDPRFVARRIMISAAEDVGLADPSVLQTAVAAAQAVAMVGMPEAQIILAEAVLAVATAPKSNTAVVAISKATEDVRSGKAGPVPLHLRDGHSSGSRKLGHGLDYVYSHDQPHAIAAGQTYLPDALRDANYYVPTGRGEEARIAASMEAIARLHKKATIQQGDQPLI